MPTNEMRSAAGCSSIPHLLRNSNPRPIARTCSSISEAGILLISPFRFASVADPAKACAVSRPHRGEWPTWTREKAKRSGLQQKIDDDTASASLFGG